MAFKHLTSRDNAVFKHLKKIAGHARDRRREALTLLDGVHLVQAYIAMFGEPNLLIIPEGKSTAEATMLIQDLQDVDTVMFPTLMFAELSPVVNSTGILALVKIPSIAPPENINFALMLEDIQDPGNLGSILRTAAAAAVDVVYLSKGCTDVWSPKTLRGGQGAQFVLPVVENSDVVTVLSTFDGTTYATVVEGESIYAQDLVRPSMFVLGNEGAGLSAVALATANKKVMIPMEQTEAIALESLNVAAAAAITLFECKRQRSCSTSD